MLSTTEPKPTEEHQMVSFVVINHPTQLQLSITAPLLTNRHNPCVLRSLTHTHSQDHKLTPFMQRLAFDLFRYHSAAITDISVERDSLTVRHDGNLKVGQARRYIRDSAFQTGAIYVD